MKFLNQFFFQKQFLTHNGLFTFNLTLTLNFNPKPLP